ncbi:MAG TPA: HAD-IIB family hydrolase [Candidatus Acidoferrum sp.]|nr:HAD-IIB family hydrolase [Candidatus Acidoferrum sp.]
MRYLALASDYDGTLADRGTVRPSSIAALRRLAASGRKLVLVTGRQLDDLLAIFPEHVMFHRIVAENGALLYNPSTRESRPLGEPPPPEFIEALREAGVSPISVGTSIIATVLPHDTAVLKVIHELGLEMQVIYNRHNVMILPSGVNKGTGVRAGLAELGLSPHNAVGVGDAENDHALLNVCECRVAVANAIPTLKERADLVTSDPDGLGVEQLIDKILFDDLRSVRPRAPRYPIVFGRTADGKEVTIPSYGTSLLVAGPSGSGKTNAVVTILERLIENRYQFCLIDPEGDYDRLENVLTLGTTHRAPDIAEIIAVLQKPKTSVSVNLLGVPMRDRPRFFASLLPQIQELRAKTGRPHWLVIDEAHHLLPAGSGAAAGTIPADLTNLLLTTIHPSAVLASVVKMTQGIIAVGPSPEQTIQEFSAAVGKPSPIHTPLPSEKGEAFVWFVDDPRGLMAVRVQPSSIEMRRHQRKYAEGRLAPETSFFFKGPQGKLNLRAHNLMMFNEIAEGVDDETWMFHLRQNHYSDWIRRAIKDDALASEVSAVENDSRATARDSRARIIQAVSNRYTTPETPAD